jgi:hypothetical protein
MELLNRGHIYSPKSDDEEATFTKYVLELADEYPDQLTAIMEAMDNMFSCEMFCKQTERLQLEALDFDPTDHSIIGYFIKSYGLFIITIEKRGTYETKPIHYRMIMDFTKYEDILVFRILNMVLMECRSINVILDHELSFGG